MRCVEQLETRDLLATFLVTTVAESGDGSLRTAIERANETPGADTIGFDIPGPGPHRILITKSLPLISDPVTIDGYTQPGSRPNRLDLGFDGILNIELRGTYGLAPDTTILSSGLFVTAGESSIRGLVVSGFSGHGIQLDSSGNRVEGNIVGLDPTGSVAIPNFLDGIRVQLHDQARSNTVGGTTPEARNLVSGNAEHGIVVFGHDNRVEGNIVGLDATGTRAIGNDGHGIAIDFGGQRNTIGGSVAGARNVVSGNNVTSFEYGAGISIQGGAEDNVVQGNFVGTDITGTRVIGNRADGIILDGLYPNTVGGADPGEGNLVSGNARHGISVRSSSYGFRVEGNRIGTDVTGRKPVSNSADGIRLVFFDYFDTSSVIGNKGSAGNRVAHNLGNGITLEREGSGQPVIVFAVLVGNQVEANAGLAVASTGVGVIEYPAGPGDGPAWDARGLPARPVLESVSREGSRIVGRGLIEGVPGVTYTVRITANAGAVATEVDSVTAVPDSTGRAAFAFTLPPTLPPGSVLTATSTDLDSATSAPSRPLSVPDEFYAPRISSFVRRGFHTIPTRLMVTFDQSMAPSTTSDARHYTLIAPGRDGRFGTRDDRTVHLRSVKYNASTRMATVTPRPLLPRTSRFRLVVSGRVTDTYGRGLDGRADGHPGTDAVLDVASFVVRIPARRA